MQPDDLERLVDRALKELPPPRAPRTLAPRVMAAVAAQPAVGRSPRPWLSWPLGWQLASLAMVIALGAGAAQLWSLLGNTPAAALGLDRAATVATAAADVAGKASTLVNASRIMWHGVVQPFVAYLLVLVLVMCAACAAFGAALGRVVLRGVPQT